MQVERIAVARVKGPHGLKGEVKVISLTDFPSRFKPGLELFISPPLSWTDKLVIEKARQEARGLVLKFKSIDNRELAEDLKGRLLDIPVDEAESLPEGSYWQFQIVGLEVYDTKDVYLGKVCDILQTGANDVYIVKSSESAKEILIPAIKKVVKSVDLERGVLIVDPLPGLIEES